MKPGFELFLRNDSPDRIRVTGITLYECENVHGGCYFWDPELVLEPGRVERVKLVEPADEDARFSYRWRWTYSQVDSTTHVPDL